MQQLEAKKTKTEETNDNKQLPVEAALPDISDVLSEIDQILTPQKPRKMICCCGDERCSTGPFNLAV